MLLEDASLKALLNTLPELDRGFADLPSFQAPLDAARLQAVLQQVAGRMHDNYPYFHPFYAGQMLKPPHPIARAAYMLATWINPNNHALDGGRASSAMEKEVTAALATLFGWKQHLGHLTSGGTVANLEALYIAGQIHPDKKIVASEQAHYTHERISGVLKLPFGKVAANSAGKMDLEALEAQLREGNIGTVVVTLGTTGVGAVDPLADILLLQKHYDFRIHVDAAYGGYFTLAGNLTPDVRRHFAALNQVDSLVIDPHKHGLQPYGCGCVLFRDPSVGKYYSHDSPYTYFTSHELHLGEISLECSRAGAAAVALWATMQYFPLEHGGEFARDLARCRQAALDFHARLTADARFLTFYPPALDILVYAPKAPRASTISQRSQELFDRAAARNLHLALFKYPTQHLTTLWPKMEPDEPYVTCLRSVMMRPEQADWVEAIYGILAEEVDIY